MSGILYELYRAERHREDADGRRKDADHQRKIAETRRVEAEANFDEAIAAVDDFLTKVGDKSLEDVPAMEPVRRELLGSALAFYKRFLAKREGDARLETRVAAALMRVAKIESLLGEDQKSREAAAEAHKVYQALAKSRPSDPEVRAGLAEAEGWRRNLPQSIALWDGLVHDYPQETRYRRQLASGYNAIAVNQTDKNDITSALESHRKALAIREALVRERNDDPDLQDHLAGTLNNIGVLLARQGRLEEVLELFRRSVEHQRAAYEMKRESYEVGAALAFGLTNLGWVRRALGQRDEAVESYREALVVRQKLAREHAARRTVHRDLLGAFDHLYRAQVAAGQTVNADRTLHAMTALTESMPQATASDLYTQAWTLAASSAAISRSGDPINPAERARARDLADRAVASLRKAIDAGYKDVDHIRQSQDLDSIRDRADFKALLADFEKRIQSEIAAAAAEKVRRGEMKPEEGLKRNREAIANGEARLTQDPKNPALRAALASNLHAIGLIQGEQGQTDESLDSLQKALMIREGLVREHPTNSDYRSLQASTIAALGVPYAKRGNWAASRRSLERAEEIFRGLLREKPGDSAITDGLARREYELGEFYAKLGLWDDAAAFFARSFDRLPPAQGHLWRTPAGVMLVRGDIAGYRRLCASMAERFRQEDDPYAVTPMLEAIVIGQSEIETKHWLDLVERARSEFASSGDVGFRSWAPYVRGLCHYRMGKYHDSISILNESNALDRDWGGLMEAWNALAMAYFQAGQASEARGWLDKFDQRWRNHHILAKLIESEFQPQLQDFPWGPPIILALRNEAAGLIRRVPADWDLAFRLLRTRAYAAAGLPQKGRKNLEATDVPGGEAWYRVAQARCFVEVGLRDRAEAELEEIDRLPSIGPDNLRFCGRVWAQLGRWDRSASAHARAFDAKLPERIEDWNAYSFACLQAGDRERHRRLCSRLVETYRQEGDLWKAMGLGHVLTRDPDATEGHDWLATVDLRLPRNVWTDMVIGALHYRAGRYEEAIPPLTASLGHDPRWKSPSLSWLLLAMAHRRLGHEAEARRWLDKAIRFVDDRASTLRDPKNATRLFVNEEDWQDYQLLRREAEALFR